VSTNRPPGWPTVIPRIILASEPQVAALADFLRATFGASGDLVEGRPAELRIGDSLVMVSATEERPPAAAFLYIYVDDVDATFARGIGAGATAIEEPRDLPYGDRRAMVDDAWGNNWQIATRIR
jgi:uncharacterized glyoxalase superfamily protein PhnB